MADSTYAASPQPALGGAIATPAQAASLASGSYSRLPAPAATATATPAAPIITPTPSVPAPAPYNETNDRNTQIAQRESQFSQLDQTYNDRIAAMTKTEQDLGAKDMARANTISAMTGMTGGVDATTRAGQVDKKTNDIIAAKTQALQDEKSQAINGIYNQIDQNVQREKDIAATNARADRSAMVDTMNKSAQSNIMAFATHGIDWNTAYKDPEFQAEVNRSGKSSFEMQTLYNSSLPKSMQPSVLFSGFKGNDFVQIYRNADGTTSTTTEKADKLGIPKTAGDVATITANNKVYWYDKNSPVKSDGSLDLHEIGAKNATPAPGPSKADLSGALTWMRSQPEYDKSMESSFNSDPVKQAKVIELWKSSSKKSSSSSGSNPFAQ